MSDFSANALDNRVSESCFFSCCVGKKICGFIFHTSPRLLIDTLDNTDSKKWVYLSIHGPWLYCENSATDWPLDFPADNMSDAKLGILSFKLRDAVIEGVFVRHGSSDIKVVFRNCGVMFISGKDIEYPSWELISPDGCMYNSSDSFIVNW